MRPITFACRETLPIPPATLAAQVLDLSLWPTFRGYGPLPGIRTAAFEVQPPAVVGTRIRVESNDGSRHVEEVTGWDPPRQVRLRMGEFSPPLSRLATAFDETWTFEPADGGTRVARSFDLHPRSALARPALWLIARLLKRAIARHLRQMRDAA